MSHAGHEQAVRDMLWLLSKKYPDGAHVFEKVYVHGNLNDSVAIGLVHEFNHVFSSHEVECAPGPALVEAALFPRFLDFYHEMGRLCAALGLIDKEVAEVPVVAGPAPAVPRMGYFARKRAKEKAEDVSDSVMAELRELVLAVEGGVDATTHLLWVDGPTSVRLMACMRVLLGPENAGMTEDEVRHEMGSFMGLSIVWDSPCTKVVNMLEVPV